MHVKKLWTKGLACIAILVMAAQPTLAEEAVSSTSISATSFESYAADSALSAVSASSIAEPELPDVTDPGAEQGEDPTEPGSTAADPTISPTPSAEPTETPAVTPTEAPKETPVPTKEPEDTKKTEEKDKEKDKEDDEDELLDDAEEKEDEIDEDEEHKEGDFTGELPDPELIAAAHPVDLPPIQEDFRFTKIDNAQQVVAVVSTYIYEQPNPSSRQIAMLMRGGMVTVLSVEMNGWIYVESGSTRGFVMRDATASGSEANLAGVKWAMADEYASDENIALSSAKAKAEEQIASAGENPVQVFVLPEDNAAFAYKRITAQDAMVAKDPYVAKITEAVHERPDGESRFAGMLQPGNVVYVLEYTNDEWSYVESGEVRGFVRNVDIERPESIIIRSATTKIPQCIYEAPFNLGEEEPEQIALIPNGETLVNVRFAEEDGWASVSYNGMTGYARICDIDIEESYDASGVTDEAYGTAQMLLSQEENHALYHTFTSVYQHIGLNPLRATIIKAAENCIGNPYVWGGTDLVNGCDCSGFVQTLYGYYGINLTRTTYTQAYEGTRITLASALPGDLIYYASGTDIYHVAIYAGDGKTIEAYSSEMGIIPYVVDTDYFCWATRVIQD